MSDTTSRIDRLSHIYLYSLKQEAGFRLRSEGKGQVTLTKLNLEGIDWAIVGGESGLMRD